MAGDGTISKDGAAVLAESPFHDAAKWKCVWTIKKYHNKPDGVTEDDVPDEVVKVDGNVLTTAAINGMMNALIGVALGFTTFANANAYLGVGDGAASYGGAAASPSTSAADTDLTSALEGSTKTITGAVNNGSGLVRLTITAHGYGSNGTYIPMYVTGVTGATQANGYWTGLIVDANTIDLQGSAFSSAYVSGGTSQRCNRLRKPMQATYPTGPTSGVLTFQSQFTGNDANWQWTEFGIFNAITSGATMLNHKAQSLGTKVAGATWTLQATITIA